MHAFGNAVGDTNTRYTALLEAILDVLFEASLVCFGCAGAELGCRPGRFSGKFGDAYFGFGFPFSRVACFLNSSWRTTAAPVSCKGSTCTDPWYLHALFLNRIEMYYFNSE